MPSRYQDIEDITPRECCMISCLPFFLIYEGLRWCIDEAKKAMQSRKCHEIIKCQNLRNATFEKFFLYWKEDASTNTYIVIHIRPPVLQYKPYYSVSHLINKLWLQSPDHSINFVLTHVGSTKDITYNTIQNVKSAVKHLSEKKASSQNTIVVMDSLFNDIWQEQLMDYANNECLINDAFDVVKYISTTNSGGTI